MSLFTCCLHVQVRVTPVNYLGITWNIDQIRSIQMIGIDQVADEWMMGKLVDGVCLRNDLVYCGYYYCY